MGTMKHIRLAAAFALICGVAAPVFAKAPPASKSAEDLISKAIQDEIDRKAKEAEAARDLNKEQIDGFRDKAKGVALTEGLRLAQIMVDAESDKKLVPYRAAAADALVKRFAAEDTKDPAVRDARKEIALAILDLMKSKEGDALTAVEFVLKEWFPNYLRESKFRIDGKPGDRDKACREMRKKLKER